MKTLFISNDPTIFIADSAARARMRSYAAAMGELHIISLAGDGAIEERDGDLYLYPVRTWKLFKIRVLATRARALILEKHIEVVSAQDPFEHGLAALRAVRGTKAKLHIQIHTDFLSPWFVKTGNLRTRLLNRRRCRIADRVLPRADGVRVVSERIKTSLALYYRSGVAKPSVIPIAVTQEAPAAVPLPLNPPSDGHSVSITFALIAVGRLEPEKRLGDLFVALKSIEKQYPMVGLFVVGEGRERARLETLARTLGLANKVIFMGDRPDAWGLMRSASAFIQASAYEGYGRTLVEAALARVPIITTDVGIVGEVFKAGEDVLASPVADPTALALNITRLIEGNALRQELPRAAEAAARAHLASVGDLPSRIAFDIAQTPLRK